MRFLSPFVTFCHLFVTFWSLLTVLTLPATKPEKRGKTENSVFSHLFFSEVSDPDPSLNQPNLVKSGAGSARFSAFLEKSTLFSLSGALLTVSMGKSLPFEIHGGKLKSLLFSVLSISLLPFLAFK